jgi:hypothetical protein
MSLAATGGAYATATLLPRRWTQPVIDSIIVPAHAQGSIEMIVGLFTTSPGPSLARGSIFDLLVPPLHAISAYSVVVGNASFDATWDVGSGGYDICGEGLVLTSNGVVSFQINGGGGRTGNALENYGQALQEGTLSIVGQSVAGNQLTFVTSYQVSKTSGTATLGGECRVNTTTSLRMSSPYPDDGPA